MELALSLVAIVVAVVALGLVLGLRNQVARFSRVPRADSSAAEIERLRADIERQKQALVDIRRDLDHSQRELEELTAATQITPAPPLPRARSTGLTDLREQLRAAHREPDEGTEE